MKTPPSDAIHVSKLSDHISKTNSDLQYISFKKLSCNSKHTYCLALSIGIFTQNRENEHINYKHPK